MSCHSIGSCKRKVEPADQPGPRSLQFAAKNVGVPLPRRGLGLLQLTAMAAKVPGIGSDGIAAGNRITATFDALSQLAAEAKGSGGAKDWQGAWGSGGSGGSGGRSRIGRWNWARSPIGKCGNGI